MCDYSATSQSLPPPLINHSLSLSWPSTLKPYRYECGLQSLGRRTSRCSYPGLSAETLTFILDAINISYHFVPVTVAEQTLYGTFGASLQRVKEGADESMVALGSLTEQRLHDYKGLLLLL